MELQLQTNLIAIFLLISFLCVCFKFWSSIPIFTNWPVVGMLPSVLNNLSCLFERATEALQEHNGTFLFKGPWFCGHDFLVTSDPRNVNYILSKNFANYERDPELRETFEPFGDGIINANSDHWKVQRTILQSLFTNKKLPMAVERILFDKIVNGLFVTLDHAARNRIELDVQEVFRKFTLDAMWKLVLGMTLNHQLSVELREILQTMLDTILYRHVVPGRVWRMQKWLQIGVEKKMKQALKTFDEIVYECISKKREEIRQKGGQDQEFDLIKCMLVDNEESHSSIQALIESNKFVRDTAFTLVVAGKENSTTGLSWFLWLIATHPSVEEKILEEIKKNFEPDKKFKGVFNENELNKLIYLHGAICETLRLYPPVPFNHVVSVTTDTLPSGHYIDKNTRVLYCPYAMGRMEVIWGKDCTEFKPERWITEKNRIKHIPSYMFSVFNAGPRTCLGKSMALHKMKAVVVALIWNYKIEMVKNQLVCPRSSAILDMKYGFKVKVSKRDATI